MSKGLWIACCLALAGMASSADAACYCRFKSGYNICANAATTDICRKIDVRLKDATCRFADGTCPYRPYRHGAG